MRWSLILGSIALVAALTTVGCCNCKCECARAEGEQQEAPYTPKTVTIEIVENLDPAIEPKPNCKPVPDFIDGIWEGDTITFVNNYGVDTTVLMAPGPFVEVEAEIPLPAGASKTFTVGSNVEHDYIFGFRVTCDPRGPGPGMRGDDPGRN